MVSDGNPIPSLEEIASRLIDPIEEGPPDVIAGLLPRNGQVVIAGETNVGKSLTALEIVSSLVTERPLWGSLEPTMKAKKVLYVLGEHYDDIIKRLWNVTKLPMTDQVFLLGPEKLKFDKWLVTQGKVNLVAVEKFQKWVEGCDLVVFDPLTAFIIGGDGTENDNIHMRLLLDTMTSIAQSTGASCIVLAHQGKPMMDKTGKEHSRTKYAVRGASGIEDAATNIFYLGKSEAASDAAQKATGESIFELRMRKYKGLAPDSYMLMRDSTSLTHTLLGNRPFHEVQRIAAQADVAKVQGADTEAKISFNDAIQIVARLRGVSEQTLRRYLTS